VSSSNLTLEQFLERNRISHETWQAAGIEWPALQAISLDYERRTAELTEVAELHARLLQHCPAVHSVRWRLKDGEHLLEKIVRKRAKQAEKYANIDHQNYTRILSDLVGVRALHLFKGDWGPIHVFLSERWTHSEPPVAYVREGDPEDIRTAYGEARCKVENHPAGYRSVHYVVSSRPQKDDILTEIQVRTLFEEGWSEIDHRVRYPNFSDNQLLQLFLATFNRIAGSADELGGFVRTLSSEISRYETARQKSSAELSQHVSRIEQLASALSQQKEKTATQAKQLKELEAEAAKLRLATEVARSNVNPWSAEDATLEDLRDGFRAIAQHWHQSPEDASILLVGRPVDGSKVRYSWDGPHHKGPAPSAPKEAASQPRQQKRGSPKGA
jgi:putative GTP pyrophosphokinase